MQYQSFIRLLHFISVDVDDPESFNFSRIKKQLQAEFSLAPNGILVIEDISYNKHDVFTELDREDIGERIKHHQTIFDHKELLNLLETDSIDLDVFYDDCAGIEEDPAFVEFISPYFASSYNSVMRSLLQYPHFFEAHRWCLFTRFILPFDEETAFESLRIFLDDNLQIFHNVNKDTYTRHLDELRIWEHQPWGELVNDLPDCLFYYIEEIGVAVLNFTVQVQFREVEMSFKLSSQLLKLTRVSHANREIIVNNHSVFKKQFEKSTKTWFEKSPGGFIVAIIFLLKFLFTMDGCNGLFR